MWKRYDTQIIDNLRTVAVNFNEMLKHPEIVKIVCRDEKLLSTVNTIQKTIDSLQEYAKSNYSR